MLLCRPVLIRTAVVSWFAAIPAIICGFAMSDAVAAEPYQFAKTLDSSFLASGVAIDANTHQLFVTDRLNNLIRVYNSDGSRTGMWPTLGGVDLQFGDRPDGVSVDSPRKLIYFTDFQTGRIEVWDYSKDPNAPQFVRQIANLAPVGDFAAPSYIQVDPSTGNVAVAVYGSLRLYDATGTLLRELPMSGPDNGCALPSAIAFDFSVGRYYVGKAYVPSGFFPCQNQVTAHIHEFDLSGNFIRQFGDGVINPATALAVDPVTHLLFVGNGGRVSIFDAGGTSRGQFSVSNPVSLAVESVSHDVISANGNPMPNPDATNNVQRYSLNIPSTGRVVEYVDTADFPGSAGGHFFYTIDGSPESAVVDSGAAGNWKRTGQSFGIGGPDAVCRFYGSQEPGPNSHFYTIDPNECSFVASLQAYPTPGTTPQWNFEGLAFRETRPVAQGAVTACPAGTVPIYRAYNNAYHDGVKNPWDSNHRLTTDAAAISDLVNGYGWTNEGVVMCAQP
jgi:hypothetical protein